MGDEFPHLKRADRVGGAVERPVRFEASPGGLVAVGPDGDPAVSQQGQSMRLQAGIGIDEDLLVPLAQTDPRIASMILGRLAIVIAAYIVYAATFEAWWGATPGKRLLRCRVRTETGQPCRPTNAILRNLLRCVELYPFVTLTWTILLVFFTRNRQRLGDLIARTVVVMRTDSPHPAPGSDSAPPE